MFLAVVMDKAAVVLLCDGLAGAALYLKNCSFSAPFDNIEAPVCYIALSGFIRKKDYFAYSSWSMQGNCNCDGTSYSLDYSWEQCKREARSSSAGVRAELCFLIA